MPAEMTQEQDTTPNPAEEQQQEKLPDGAIGLHTLSDDDEDGDDGQDNSLDKRGRRSWAREAKQKLADYETRFETMQRELSELRNRPAPQPVYQPPQQTQQPQQSEAEREVQWYTQQMNVAQAALQNAPQGTPKEQLEEYAASWRQLNDARTTALIRAQMGQQQPQQQGPSVQVQMLQSQFPKIFSDPLITREAELEAYKVARAAGRQMYTYADAVEANTRVMARLGTGKPPPPTTAEKAKLTGTPGRAGASGTNGNQVPITKRDWNDAMAYFNGATGKYATYTDKQKFDHWYKNVKSKGT